MNLHWEFRGSQELISLTASNSRTSICSATLLPSSSVVKLTSFSAQDPTRATLIWTLLQKSFFPSPSTLTSFLYNNSTRCIIRIMSIPSLNRKTENLFVVLNTLVSLVLVLFSTNFQEKKMIFISCQYLILSHELLSSTTVWLPLPPPHETALAMITILLNSRLLITQTWVHWTTYWHLTKLTINHWCLLFPQSPRHLSALWNLWQHSLGPLPLSLNFTPSFSDPFPLSVLNCLLHSLLLFLFSFLIKDLLENL